MTDGPGSAVSGVHSGGGWVLRAWRLTLAQARLVAAAFVDIASATLARSQLGDMGGAEHPAGLDPASRAGGSRPRLRHRALLVERAVGVALEFVDWHGGPSPHFTTARSCPCGTDAVGPLAAGSTGKSNISVGIASVAQAFGISTMPLMRPSTGAVPRIA